MQLIALSRYMVWMCDMPQSPKTFRRRERRREVEELRGTSTQRGYDKHWSRISLAYRAHHPVCEICNDAVAVDVDHIKPFKGIGDPLRTDVINLQSVCRACHNEKTRGQG